MKPATWLATIALIFAATCLPAFIPSKLVARADQEAPASDQWSSLINPQQLQARLADPLLLVVDARSESDYAQGHIPGAINLPGSQWRSPATRSPADGPGQQIFRDAAGAIDVARYEKLLSTAGIKPEHKVVVYGNHAGKADGSLPASLLLKLGHQSVSFLDGVGVDRWKQAGFPISTEAKRLAPSQYAAAPDAKRLWSTQQLLSNLNNQDVVIIDSRTPAEFAGEDLRGNARGGHIPGAVSLDTEQFLDKQSNTTIPLSAAKAKIEALIPKDKTIVVYCQSGTRCSHEELILKDLGYTNVVLYDASWQEWGNRQDTPVEKPAAK